MANYVSTSPSITVFFFIVKPLLIGKSLFDDNRLLFIPLRRNRIKLFRMRYSERAVSIFTSGS